MIDEKQKAETAEPVKEPAKRWVNQFRADAPFVLHADNGRFRVNAGDEFTNRPFPTYEIAEQRALDLIAQARGAGGALTLIATFLEQAQ